MKNNCSIIEKLFQKNKNDIFLFGISFFVFLLCKLGKWWCHKVCNYCKILNKWYLWEYWSSVFQTFSPEMFIKKDTKWNLLCCCHDSSSAAGPVLIKTTIPSFYLNQGPSTPANLMVRGKTIWLQCLFQTAVSVWGHLVSYWKRLEPKEFPWQQYYGYYLVSFVLNIFGVKFEKHSFYISGI